MVMTAVLTASATFAPADRVSDLAFVRLEEAKKKPRTGEDGASRVPGEGEPWMGVHPIPVYIGHPDDNFQYCLLIGSIRKPYAGLTGIAYAKNRPGAASTRSSQPCASANLPKSCGSLSARRNGVAMRMATPSLGRFVAVKPREGVHFRRFLSADTWLANTLVAHRRESNVIH